MNKLVAGQECYVSNLSEDKALEYKTKALFVGYRKNGDMVFEVDANHALFTRQYAVPIPEKKVTPWTLETFPLETIWVRRKSSKATKFLIIKVGDMKAYINGDWVSYTILAENYERITNDSILPCGVYDE